ncbi:uncharacterized protein LOC103312666 [Tribolium castaneum]|uniref:DUF753 domain-containing protein n=1 Tax=Tribolium castaneum TaxID=7070 RepID=D1ZZN3_TRICA|nr:PREDICTED: uncharacterized protein LOC103312666 [Tribolium castaneum]EFA01826.1 hypothetical protein TcasGA2_TC007428 [Tribolium castaneum]|eukprot:XP_008192112.1 PREDICTED: uncharacterized protein LOC103312666 [Tribolium castaneum]
MNRIVILAFASILVIGQLDLAEGAKKCYGCGKLGGNCDKKFQIEVPCIKGDAKCFTAKDTKGGTTLKGCLEVESLCQNSESKKCWTCSSDLCNGGLGVGFNAFVLAAPGLLALFRLFF